MGVGQGDFHGRPSIIIAQYFGRPAPAATSVPEKTAAKKAKTDKKEAAPSTTLTLPERPAAVLGAADVKTTTPDVLATPSFSDWTRIALYCLLALVLLPFSLALVRIHRLPFRVITRTFIFVAVIAVVCAAGLPIGPNPQLATPAEFSDITWTGL